MKKPEWLNAFPFVLKHWDEVVSLINLHPDLGRFELAADWQNYLEQCQLSQASIDWFKIFRKYRQSRLAYMAYCDIHLPLESHVKTMHLVAALADHLIMKAYEVAQDEMIARHGVVFDETGLPVELMVFALGKLGTTELNYSSDVDLVFLYEKDGKSDGKRSLASADYFVRMGQKIIKLLDYFSQDGQVYRVDMRLRPFGSAGPLACSVNALQNYLLHEGRDWERFAWMRARMICGKSEAAVMAVLTPFIYRRHLDYQVFDALAVIKSEITSHATIAVEHLKLGHGGIRVIEFIVQSLQLVFGGRNEQLRGVDVFPQIDCLTAMNKLTKQAATELKRTWLVLRKIENLVQAVDDQAEHHYPENNSVQKVICKAIKFENWQQLTQQLFGWRDQIDQLFNDLFEVRHQANQLKTTQRQDVNEIMHALPLSRMPQNRADQVKDLIGVVVHKTNNEEVINHFVKLIKQILTRPAYLLMLLKESNLLAAVLELIEKNSYFAETLQQHPILLEQLFEYEPFVEFDAIGLQNKWLPLKPKDKDVETWLESIRLFKNIQQFNLLVAWSNADFDDSTACRQITQLAKFNLLKVLQFSYAELALKQPDIKIRDEDLIVLAYGSAATSEMTVNSDLDLVFVLDVAELSQENRIFAQKWVKRISHHLSSQMYNGRLYALDMQLRPNGHSGPLITTCAEYANYQRNKAWIWEHAAMLKSRAIVGTEAQVTWHQKLRCEVLSRQRDPLEVDMALNEMADKLVTRKQSKNHHMEFNILGLVLKNAYRYPELLSLKRLEEYEQILNERGLLAAGDIRKNGIKKGPTD